MSTTNTETRTTRSSVRRAVTVEPAAAPIAGRATLDKDVPPPNPPPEDPNDPPPGGNGGAPDPDDNDNTCWGIVRGHSNCIYTANQDIKLSLTLHPFGVEVMVLVGTCDSHNRYVGHSCLRGLPETPSRF